jgi:hypothetical protein
MKIDLLRSFQGGAATKIGVIDRISLTQTVVNLCFWLRFPQLNLAILGVTSHPQIY